MLFNDKRVQLHLVTSDASSSWGCEALCGKDWFQLSWPEVTWELYITVNEQIPIVLAAEVWGGKWKGKILL